MTLSAFVSELLQALLPILATALVGLMSTAGAYLYSLVKAKLGAQAADTQARYWTILEQVAGHTVIAMQQSVVDRLKADGAWNANTAKEVKKAALAAALAGLGDAKEQIGARLLIDVPAMMELLLERALHDHKAFGEYVKAVPGETLAVHPIQDTPGALQPSDLAALEELVTKAVKSSTAEGAPK